MEDASVSDFLYGPDESRFYQKKQVSGSVVETFYVAKGAFEEEIRDGQSTFKSYLDGFLIDKRGAQNSQIFLLRDHLGSVDVVVDSDVTDGLQDSVIETTSFKPFGERRLDDRSGSTLNPSTVSRGFTDHEHLDEFGLIHMNGRVYDPVVGRFLSPDPFVQYPSNSQSYNRYSYVLNNPLSNTDPSGYIALPFFFLPVLEFIGLDALIWGSSGIFASAFIIDTSDQLLGEIENTTALTFPVEESGPMYLPGSEIEEQYFADYAFPGASPVYDAPIMSGGRPIVDSIPISHENIPEQIDLGPMLNVDSLTRDVSLIKPGAANGPTATQAFPKRVKDAAKAENPTATCVYCRMEGTATQVDHAIPRARGGDATLDNAQLACPHCNASKGARDYPKTPPPGYVGPWPPAHW